MTKKITKLMLNGEGYEIREYQQGWQPGANTLIYLLLNGDADNLGTYGSSGNGTIDSNGGSYTWEYIIGASGKKCFSMSATDTDGAYIYGNYDSTPLGSGDRTVSMWYKWEGSLEAGSPRYLGSLGGGDQGGWFGYFWNNGKGGILRYYGDPQTGVLSLSAGWHNFVITYSNSHFGNMYIDGVQQTILENQYSTFNTVNTGYQLGMLRMGMNGTKTYYLADFIVENTERTAQEVSDYFNQTKSLYGIS